jgi:predicted metal-dependent phosphoesterase TrpH
MRFVPGVEISITWANQTVHIVGLQIDETNAGPAGKAWPRPAAGATRAGARSPPSWPAGIPGAYEGALKYVGNPDLLSRTHFARYLVECGACAQYPEVFRKYLTEGKPGYVPHRWASLQQAVAGSAAPAASRDRASGALQVQRAVGEGALFDEFKQLGGGAIEVVTGSHTPDQYAIYAEQARRYGFLASRGTDFHAPGESRVEFALLPPLPSRRDPGLARLVLKKNDGRPERGTINVVLAHAGTHTEHA